MKMQCSGASKVLVNFNDYLGGGETLLLRFADYAQKSCIKIICSANSYIDKNLVSPFKYSYSGDYAFNYLSNRNRLKLFNWIKSSVGESDIFVTFCFRDLHLITSYIKFFELSNCRVVHLLLHPLDHMYLCQSIIDKLISKFYSEQSYSIATNRLVNGSLLKELSISNSLISMNRNVSQRIFKDHSIYISDDFLIPLPVIDKNYIFQKLSQKFNCQIKKILWVGRIVDFKISAIIAMIDFVHLNDGFSFDIIGYGNEKLILSYLKKIKAKPGKVNIIGKINYSELPSVVTSYHIGYGMGTSVIELTALGLPTIVALASPNFENFDSSICAGTVYVQDIGNVGDDFYATEKSDFPLIDNVIQEIILDPQLVVEKSLNYIKNMYDLDSNFERYLSVINNCSSQDYSKFQTFNVGWFRKLIYKIMAFK